MRPRPSARLPSQSSASIRPNAHGLAVTARQKSAFELAVGALSRKERTVAELRAWLAKREVEPAEAEEAIERLVEMGQLDDERYAALFTQDKRELFGWGPARIREALIDKGSRRRYRRGGGRR